MKKPTKDDLRDLDHLLEQAAIAEFWALSNKVSRDENLKKAREMVKSWRE